MSESLNRETLTCYYAKMFAKNNPKIKITPFLTCFPYRRSPSAYFEGTHGDRAAGDNTRCSHRKGHFTYYATSTAWRLRNKMPRILVLIIELRRSLFSPSCGSCFVFEVAYSVYE